jgi:hypothetical protein
VRPANDSIWSAVERTSSQALAHPSARSARLIGPDLRGARAPRAEGTIRRASRERRRGPSPLTAFREATKGKRPAGKRPSQQGSGLAEMRTA